MRRILFFAAAAGIAFLAARWVSDWLEKRPETPKQQLTAVMARADIAAGERITAKNVELAPWPGKTLPIAVFSRTEMVVGRVAASRILRGEPVHEKRLVPRGQALETELARRIDKGMRAVAIRLDRRADRFRAGDRVDIFAASGLKDESPFEQVARMVAENVRVLAVDGGDEEEKGFSSGRKKPSATLLLTAEQTRILAASDRETLRLVKRNQYDTATAVSDPVFFSPLLGPQQRSDMGDSGKKAVETALTKGMRVVTLPFTQDDGFCGWIMPGTRVDVVAVSSQGDVSVESTAPGARAEYLDTRKFSKILFQDVPVIATRISPEKKGKGERDPLQATLERGIDRLITQLNQEKKETDGDGEKGGEKSKKPRAKTIGYLSLMADADQAEQLIMAADGYQLRFIYRNQADAGIAETQGKELKNCYFKPFDARAYQVEIYRGGREFRVPMPRAREISKPYSPPQTEEIQFR